MKKSFASVTVAASLLGGAAGAIVFAPNLVSAQSESETTTEIEPDTATGRGALLGEILSGLVDDGTLTEAQADAVVDAIVDAIDQARPERGEGYWGRGPAGFDGIGELSELLGLAPQEIAEALRSGESLAEIAVAQGVDPQRIIEAIVDRAAERLDEAVADGHVDEADAAERLADITERITDAVNGDAGFAGPPRSHGHGNGFGDRGDRHFGHGLFGHSSDSGTSSDGADT